MADNCPVPNRIVSTNMYVTWEPCGDSAEEHVVELIFQGTDTPSGTFRLWVDGKFTAPITYNATIGTLVTAVQAALDAVDNAAFVVADNGSGIVEITAAAVGYHRFLGYKVTLNVDVRPVVITQGTEDVAITAQLSQVNFEASVDTTDVTPINEFARTEIPVASTVTFELNMYDANTAEDFFFYEGASGVLTIYDEGQVVGSKYQSFMALVESYGKDYPDHDKLEITLSGMRQGDWLVPLGTIYTG